MLIRLLSAFAQNGEVLSAGEMVNLVTHQAQDLVAKGHAETILLQHAAKSEEAYTSTSETCITTSGAGQDPAPAEEVDIPTKGAGQKPAFTETPADLQPQTIPLGRTGGKKG